MRILLEPRPDQCTDIEMTESLTPRCGLSPALDREPTGAVAGIDRGVRTALVTSDGQHYRVPRISDRRAARYLALQRRMSRQQKGSRKPSGVPVRGLRS